MNTNENLNQYSKNKKFVQDPDEKYVPKRRYFGEKEEEKKK